MELQRTWLSEEVRSEVKEPWTERKSRRIRRQVQLWYIADMAVSPNKPSEASCIAGKLEQPVLVLLVVRLKYLWLCLCRFLVPHFLELGM